MEFVEKKEFNDNVNAFKKLRLEDKESIVENELKEIISLFEIVAKQSDFKILYNREILDTVGNHTEDDFVESVYVYIQSIKEILADYINMKENI